MFGRILSRAIALSFFVLVSALFVLAQDLDDVTISGKVTDSNGLAVVGASVIVRSVETGESRTFVSDEEGRYRFLKLKPGTYTVKVSASGFGIQETPAFPTISAQVLQKDFKVVPADVKAEQTVTVTEDDAPMVDVTRTIVGSTLTERDIEEIPNSTRNPLDLILALGGTSEEALSSRDLAEDTNQNNRQAPTEQGNFTISGGASFSNNITIDGLDNNDDYAAQSRFAPSTEAVAEVQVIRNQFSAEYGRASGGRINLRTRGGSNKYKGRAFMFYKNDNTNANTWYNNSRGFPRRDFVDYNPGFTFGGPVIIPFGEGHSIYDGHNRTFFFVSYDREDLRDTTFIDTWVPIVQNPGWTLPLPTGPARFCDNLLASAPPCPANVGEIGEYTKTLATPNRIDTMTWRLDHRLFHGNDLTVSYQFGRKRLMRTSSNLPSARTDDAIQARRQNTDGLNFTDSHVFGSNMVNQFRFQWSTYKPSFETDDPFAPVLIIPVFNAETHSTSPNLVSGNSTASLSNSNIFADSRKERRYQFQETLTYVVGHHTLKGGFDAQNINSRNIVLTDATGTWNFNPHGSFQSAAYNFATGNVSQYRQNFGGDVLVRNTYWGAFLNDEIALPRRITLSAGLRYERETAVKDTDNWGPRVGLAWAPFKNNRDVIRVGGGMFFNRVLLRTIFNNIQSNSGELLNFNSTGLSGSNTSGAEAAFLTLVSQHFPHAFTRTELRALALSVPGACTTTNNCGFTANTSGNPFRTIDPNLKIPESYQFNVGFERQLTKGWVFEANYTFNQTHHLWREYDRNGAMLPDGFNDYAEWLQGPGKIFQFRSETGTLLRTYEFFADPLHPGIGVSASKDVQTSCSTTNATATCFVNLASSVTTRTSPTSSAVGNAMGVANFALNALRADPDNEDKETVASIGNSRYNGLVLELRSRFRQLGGGFGSSMRFVYTLSRMMDDGLNNTTNATFGADFAHEWARARQDRLHKFNVSGSVQTPWWMGKLRLSPLFRFGSSAPFDLGMGIDRNNNYNSNDRPNFSGNLNEIVWREPGTPFPQELYDKFSLPLIGARGNIPRDAGRGPKMYIFDLNIGRDFRFRDRFRLKPTIEIDNVLNMRVFNFGSEFINFFGTTTPTQIQKDGFLVPTRTYRPRDIRFGMRFDF